MAMQTNSAKRSGGLSVGGPSQGFVLVTTLVLLLSMTVLAGTVAYRTVLNENMAANQRDGIKAMVTAENGIEAGYALVEKDYISGTEFYSGLFEVNGSFVSSQSGYGGYHVEVTRDEDSTGDEMAILTSTGSINGAVREIQIVMQMKRPPSANLTAPKELIVTAWREVIR